MSTLIAVYNSSGPDGKLRCVGRCDAKCYEAREAHCDCICGGANHGKGAEKAQQQTTEKYTEWLDAYRQEHPVDTVEVPILYDSKSKAAREIARIANLYYKYNHGLINPVRNVKRAHLESGRIGWRITSQTPKGRLTINVNSLSTARALFSTRLPVQLTLPIEEPDNVTPAA
jgi:hypothetical protein